MAQLKSIWQNRLTEIGALIAAVAILFFITFQVIELMSATSNPYTGLWTFLVFPVIMIIGLILIPLGYFRERRRRRKLFPDVKDWPRLPHFDPNNPVHRKAFAVVTLGSMVVIPLIFISSYQGYHYTESTGFCGQVCHEVMQPEFTAYSGSPHARVTCAACHIGPGASWYVKSKISGLRQVLAVTLNTFSRPIPTPIKDLRPARETCEQCHWPAKFFGSQLRTRVHYGPDEKNTRREIRVLVKTGGADSSMGPASGIHWHMALSHKIEYIAADEQRQIIPWVRSTDSEGKVKIFRSDDKTPSDPPPPGEIRRIDCVDCHNRPTHNFQPPDRAVNISLETNRIDRQLPFAKKIAVEALTEPYGNSAEAEEGIKSYIRDAYQKLDPKVAADQRGPINQVIDEVRAIYRRNFFPTMKSDWKRYPDNIGHMIFDGCFRCHDNKHVTDGRYPIRKDCGVCHEFQQGVTVDNFGGVPATFQEHPYKLEGTHLDLNCSRCHDGGRAPVADCGGCHTTQTAFRQGKAPLMQGMKPIPPAAMADLSCDSCHDMSKGGTGKVTEQCETCHEKGYGEMAKSWIDDAKASRAKAAAAIEELRKKGGAAAQIATQMQALLEQVDAAGPQHNTELADAIYQQIIKTAAGNQ